MQNLYKEDLVKFIDEIEHPVWVYDHENYCILTANKSAVNLLGYSIEELKQLTIFNLRSPEENQYFLENKTWKKHNFDFNTYDKLTNKYGREILSDLNSKEIIYKKRHAVLVSVYDLTDRITYERKLKESEEKFRISQEISLDAFTIMKCVRDNSGEIIDFTWQYVNPAAERILKYSSDELIGKRLLELMPGNRSELFAIYKKVVETGTPMDMEIRYHDENIDGWFRNMTIKLEDGIAVSFHDITQRKFQQQEIENTVREMNNVLERISDAFIAMDTKGNITYLNLSAAKILQSERSVVGKNFWETFPVYRNDFEPHLLKALETQEVQVFDVEGKLTPRWYRISVYPSPEGITAYVLDTTLSRAYEEQLLSSLRQKETLLKEVHHRIKNNLQIIISILNLQSYYIKDPAALEIFRQSQNRIRSMALIHEKLYKTEGLSLVNLRHYLADIVKYLLETYSVSDNKVNIIFEMEDIEFDSNTAISFGLIINELISNCLKYAFPGNMNGQIKLSAKRVDEDMLFEISDNGKGFPNAINFRDTKSLGLQLVNTLVEQLNGEIELMKEHGTTFRIVFPSPNYTATIRTED